MQLLDNINRLMNQGHAGCPVAGALGECAMIERRGDTTHGAAVYAWKDEVTPEMIAGWFKSEGCTDITVSQIMHCENNGDRNGRVPEGDARGFDVSFTYEPKEIIARLGRHAYERKVADVALKDLRASLVPAFTREPYAPGVMVRAISERLERISELADQMLAATRCQPRLTPLAVNDLRISMALALDMARGYTAALQSLTNQEEEHHRILQDDLTKTEPPF